MRPLSSKRGLWVPKNIVRAPPLTHVRSAALHLTPLHPTCLPKTLFLDTLFWVYFVAIIEKYGGGGKVGHVRADSAVPTLLNTLRPGKSPAISTTSDAPQGLWGKVEGRGGAKWWRA